MNTAPLKAYAPQARKDFIAAVMAQAARLGISAAGTQPAQVQGDVLLVAGQAFPRSIADARKRLAERIRDKGFDATMEAVAYTWFNRFMAIRYMELHGYLDHGYRVLSHPDGQPHPEILDHAADVDLLGPNRAKAIELKLDGTKDEELYRLLLKAQCNALSHAMPFLFESVGGEDELLLPANLLHTDSLIRQLVEKIPEELWQDIEIIGWLYQFYITEKKDQVIGKVVKSEDIPAATQLFTPNWIVKYMVQNSLGAQWLATYPQSPLKGQMEYYIEPAEQTDEVKAQLAAITPSTLNPEELTLIDPASGSGHILVEAYELFKAIYLERGYRQRDVPQLILEKNLFGLDIDGRAAQLTGFALMMKGRADDRRLFERGVKLNVMALVDSGQWTADSGQQAIGNDLFASRDRKGAGGLAVLRPLVDESLFGSIRELVELFEHATTFGSLIQVPKKLAKKLPALKKLSETSGQDLFVSETLKRLAPLVQQAELLAAQYDAVVANPPYMGSKYHTPVLKKFAKDRFPEARSDLFACFIERGFTLANVTGHNAMITMESWMFLPSYERFRHTVLERHTLRTLAHFPYDGKLPTVMGINFGVAVMSAKNTHVTGYQGHYCCSRYYELNDDGVPFEFPTTNERLRIVAAEEFRKIPGSPVAYWAPAPTLDAFRTLGRLEEMAPTRKGMVTANNAIYVRHWYEVDGDRLGLRMDDRVTAKQSGRKWFPYIKGGDFRRWYGNRSEVVDWENDGQRLRETRHPTEDRTWATNFNLEHIFKPNVNWSDVTSGRFSARLSTGSSLFDATGLSCFPDSSQRLRILAFMNTKIVDGFLQMLNPTLHYQAGNIADLPFPPEDLDSSLDTLVEWLTRSAAIDWNAYEYSWDFQSLPILTASSDPTPTLESGYIAWVTQNRNTIAEMKRLVLLPTLSQK